MSFNKAIKYQLKFKRIIQHGCVGKIALFDKALVVALARVALAMCAIWVGFKFRAQYLTVVLSNNIVSLKFKIFFFYTWW